MKRNAYARYIMAFAVTALAIVATHNMPKPLTAPTVLFFGAVAFASWYGGFIPGLISSALSAIAFYYYFAPAYFSWTKNDPSEVLIAMIGFILISSLVNFLITVFIGAKRDISAARLAGERKAQMIADSLPQIVWSTDASGQTEYLNKFWYEYTGLKNGDSGGWDEFIHPADMESLDLAWQEAQKKCQDFEFEFRIRRGVDGVYRWFLGRVICLKGEGGLAERWLGSAIDIDERKRDEAIQRFIISAGQALNTSLDFQTTLQDLANLIVPDISDWCTIDIINEETNELERAAVSHKDPDKVTLGWELSRKFPARREHGGLLWRAIQSGEIQHLESLTRDKLQKIIPYPEYIDALLELGLKSVVVAPLKVRGETIGAISFISSESGRSYDEKDIAVIETLLPIAVQAIENARLFTDLRRAKDQLKIVLESVQDGIIVQDKLGRLVFANAAASSLAGFSSGEQFIQAGIDHLFKDQKLYDESGRTIKQADLTAGHVLCGKEVPPRVLKYIGRDSSHGWMSIKSAPVLDPRGSIEYAVTVLTDITNIKKAEEINSRLAAIVQSSQDAIIGESLDGRIISWNQGATDLYGYQPEEVIGRHFSILMKDGEDLKRHRGETFDEGKPKIHADTVRRRKDGTFVEVAITVSPVYDESGTLIGAATIARDITQRKALERQKDDFISVASHELKTPLTSMKVFAQSLLRGARRREGGEVEVQQLEVINRQIDKLVSLIRNILDVSKLEYGQVEMHYRHVNLGAFFEDLLPRLQPLLSSHSLHLEIDRDLNVQMDPDRIEQVFINIIGNAVQYSAPGTDIEIHAAKKGQEVVMSVGDQGRGIPEYVLKNLFERFFQADPKMSKGLGLGLYITKQIIEHHQGKVWVESAKGEGTTFFFSLPLATIKTEGIKTFGFSEA